jgi:hypothetical protein
MVVSHGLFSGASGIIISFTGKYNPVIITGGAIWTAASIWKTLYGQNTPTWAFIFNGILEGIGLGFCFQSGTVKITSCRGIKIQFEYLTGSFILSSCGSACTLSQG